MHQAMSYHIFNTHEYIKALIKTSMKEKQAEILVKGLLESREYDFSRLATKDELMATKQELKAELAELKAEVSGIKVDILKWMIPLLFTVIAMVATVMFKMLGH
jgi:hypothetical protein